MIALPDLSVVHARKAWVWLASTAALVLAGAVTPSHAQQGAWRPDRPVEIVIPSAAGSSLDAAARLIQRILTENRLIEVSAIVVEIVPSRLTGGVTTSAARTDTGEVEAQAQPTPTPEPAEIVPQAILLALSAQDALVLKHIKDAGGVIDIVLRAPTAEARFELSPVMAEYLRDRYELVISR